MIRSFNWRDFPELHRNRNDGVWLDTALSLTRWMALVPAGALLATLAPATGVFTFVATNNESRASQVVGQFAHPPGASNAKLTFITPEGAIDSPDVPALLDHLAVQAGERGAHNLLAEVNESSIAFDALRKAGFAVYTRQRVWTLAPGRQRENRLWRAVGAGDELQVHHLYLSIVPALVQQTEPPPWENMHGLVHEQDGELLAYVHVSSGPKGLLAQPLVHPDTDDAEALMRSLGGAIPNARSRPVYLCVRSHQAWLAPLLDGLDFESGPYQAVMVKRLAVPVKDFVFAAAGRGMKNAQPEISTFSRDPGGHHRPAPDPAKIQDIRSASG